MTDDGQHARYRLVEMTAWETFEATATGLLRTGGLTLQGLHEVHHLLTAGPWSPAPNQLPLPPEIATRKKLLFHDVARAALDNGHPWPHTEDLIYFDVPDDLSGT